MVTNTTLSVLYIDGTNTASAAGGSVGFHLNVPLHLSTVCSMSGWRF